MPPHSTLNAIHSLRLQLKPPPPLLLLQQQQPTPPQPPPPRPQSCGTTSPSAPPSPMSPHYVGCDCVACCRYAFEAGDYASKKVAAARSCRCPATRIVTHQPQVTISITLPSVGSLPKEDVKVTCGARTRRCPAALARAAAASSFIFLMSLLQVLFTKRSLDLQVRGGRLVWGGGGALFVAIIILARHVYSSGHWPCWRQPQAARAVRHPKPKTSKPKTQNPKLQTSYPKPQTPILKPKPSRASVLE